MSLYTSTFGEAISGANTPGQSDSTQNGLLAAPNPLFRAMNKQSLTDLTSLSNGSVGTFLQSQGRVSGNVASIINATLNYVSSGGSQRLPDISPAVKNSTSKRTFIPIIIKTDFYFTTTTSGTAGIPAPLYIIFDSTPEDITFAKTANWNPTNFLGRPEPVWTYQNSGPIQFNLTGKFYAESVEAHGKLLKLSDYIMSLASPSKSNYMPSPITLYIGQWKELHCIVNSVSIKFSGPWTVKVTADDLEQAINNKDNNAITAINAALGNQASVSIPAHAPYLFEATFTFTVVNIDNKVLYAEQIVTNGFNKNSDSMRRSPGDDLNSEDAKEALANFALPSSPAPPTTANSGIYSLTNTNSYTFKDGRIQTAVSHQIDYTQGGQTINTPSNLGDLGVITNALSAQMLSLFQRANPTSTQTPRTTNSLNPLQRLF